MTVTREAHEREIERGLLIHLRDLLLELGRGFAFVGSQVPLEVGDETFYLDLLFYHVRLHCYFVIELKTGRFKPEWAGKLNFYLSAVDDLFRTGPDAPTIGLLLCESHRSPIVEYTLRSIDKPIGVSSYRVTRELPQPISEEVGVRLALGAARHQIRAMVLREAGWLAIAGVTIGLGTAMLLIRMVQSMLYGLKPSDPLSLTGSVFLLLTMALIAGWIPAARASKVEPMDALRHD